MSLLSSLFSLLSPSYFSSFSLLRFFFSLLLPTLFFTFSQQPLSLPRFPSLSHFFFSLPCATFFLSCTFSENSPLLSPFYFPPLFNFFFLFSCTFSLSPLPFQPSFTSPKILFSSLSLFQPPLFSLSSNYLSLSFIFSLLTTSPSREFFPTELGRGKAWVRPINTPTSLNKKAIPL